MGFGSRIISYQTCRIYCIARVLMLFTRGFIGFSRQEFVDSSQKNAFKSVFLGPSFALSVSHWCETV